MWSKQGFKFFLFDIMKVIIFFSFIMMKLISIAFSKFINRAITIQCEINAAYYNNAERITAWKITNSPKKRRLKMTLHDLIFIVWNTAFAWSVLLYTCINNLSSDVMISPKYLNKLTCLNILPSIVISHFNVIIFIDIASVSVFLTFKWNPLFALSIVCNVQEERVARRKECQAHSTSWSVIPCKAGIFVYHM